MVAISSILISRTTSDHSKNGFIVFFDPQNMGVPSFAIPVNKALKSW